MIDALNLVWIIPAVAAVSFYFGAALTSGNDPPAEEEPDVCKHCMCIHCPYNPSLIYNENT